MSVYKKRAITVRSRLLDVLNMYGVLVTSGRQIFGVAKASDGFLQNS